jgi:DnaK suppressor protein
MSEFENQKKYVAKDNEEFMNSKQVAYFKALLLSWKAHLLDEVSSTISHLQDDASQVADMNDRATLEEEFALELRTRDRERQLISKIDKSLRDIDLEEYGFCMTCGADINLARLNARPTATQCIDCKTISEKQAI